MTQKIDGGWTPPTVALQYKGNLKKKLGQKLFVFLGGFRATSNKIGVQKLPKKAIFCLKNVKNVESSIHFCFSQKMFIPPMRLKKHLALNCQ